MKTIKSKPNLRPIFNIRLMGEKLVSRNKYLIIGLYLIIAFSLLLVASRSSPLYPFNDWVDVNTFFTMGKGMMQGKLPYRDLFDHKGPLLYLIYGIAYLISPRDFLGVYILECALFSIFLFFIDRIMSLFLRRKFALLSLPFLAASILNLRSFAYGGTAESFTFPLLMAGLFQFTNYFQKRYPKAPPIIEGFIQGIIAGCVLWIKYSFLGFWLGWVSVIIVSALINKEFIPILKFSLSFLTGLVIATLPWILYFGINGAISDWFQAYFVVNLTAYAKGFSLREILQTAIDSYQRHLQFNPITISLMTLGILLSTTLKNFNKTWWFSLGLYLSIGFLALGVYAGGRDYIYYFLIFAPFLVFGFIQIVKLYQESYSQIKSNFLFFMLIFFFLMISFAYTFRFNRNTDFMNTDRKDLVQYKFAKIINQTEDPGLLNYGFQDSGFYTTTGIVPSVKYFQKYNFEYGHFPINMDEQNRYIKEEIIEYVVIRYPAAEKTPDLRLLGFNINYQCVAKATQHFGEQEFTYELFKRR